MPEVTREQLVSEAREWLGTPYQAGQMVKKAGCDCGTLLLGILSNCGLVPKSLFDQYRESSPMWWAHSKDNRYLVRVMRHAKRILQSVSYPSLNIAPGNLVLVQPRSSKNRYHGGIVTAWPKIIHCVFICEEVSVLGDPMWAYRPIEVFDPFAEPEPLTDEEIASWEN